MLPYLAIAMIDTALVAFVGVVIFGVAFNGSVALFSPSPWCSPSWAWGSA
jgi:ABC-type multidrug transport system permease subunit